MSGIDDTADVSAQLRQLKQLTREIDNFRDIAKYILPTPGETPRLNGVDIFGGVMPLSGSVGGDHLIYVDFKQRFDLDARITRAREERRFDLVENLEWCRRKAGIVTALPVQAWQSQTRLEPIRPRRSTARQCGQSMTRPAMVPGPAGRVAA